MRQFAFPKTDQTFEHDAVSQHLSAFRQCEAALAKALDLTTALKPELSLMLEVYVADLNGETLTVTMLGLLDGIPPTTTLRYLHLLEEHGAIRRTAHSRDNRMTIIEITMPAKKALDDALLSIETNASASYKPAA